MQFQILNFKLLSTSLIHFIFVRHQISLSLFPYWARFSFWSFLEKLLRIHKFPVFGSSYSVLISSKVNLSHCWSRLYSSILCTHCSFISPLAISHSQHMFCILSFHFSTYSSRPALISFFPCFPDIPTSQPGPLIFYLSTDVLFVPNILSFLCFILFCSILLIAVGGVVYFLTVSL